MDISTLYGMVNATYFGKTAWLLKSINENYWTGTEFTLKETSSVGFDSSPGTGTQQD